ncbi:chloride channel protein [Sphingobacterium pedocola]|uniref:Chloride channel protein n=1 Tax=Sphingobacterium pedocola TaxID=2082722 RepID=A0ABR9T965_9SPHI|nr:chloride channel protein [Sphingobacterium pedocola]MBE8721434.1 chloride channel protein [Sphingobacterium pedocola]
MRRKVVVYNYFKLILASLFIGLISSLLADSLKYITENYQHRILEKVGQINPMIYIILPSIGITIIYFLRKYAFKNRQNKGIKEIYKTLETRKDDLPLFKIPSHYFNGFLTVIFGGSTGIEVSTVVATATVGNVVHKKGKVAFAYKNELICAGVAAGVAVLFASPIAGWLFAIEVISRKLSKPVVVSCTASVLIACVFVYFFDSEMLLPFPIDQWNWGALPYILVLSLLGGTLALYFTKIVIYVKGIFANIKSNFIRVNFGALIVGTMLFFVPYLYGDSYHGLKDAISTAMNETFSISFGLLLLFMVILKPLAASLTLGAGGDGGVFAPSIVSGAFLGLFFAQICNTYFGTELILINFVLFGAAATLSAAIHAPFTALFLICSIAPGGYILFVPLMLSSFVAKMFAKWLYPFNVYTYKEGKPIIQLK